MALNVVGINQLRKNPRLNCELLSDEVIPLIYPSVPKLTTKALTDPWIRVTFQARVPKVANPIKRARFVKVPTTPSRLSTGTPL